MVRKLTFALLAGTALSFAGAAQAADVYVPPPAEPAYVPEPAAFSWSGLYFGGHIGYARARATDPWPSCNWLNDIRGENGNPEYIFPGANYCDASFVGYYGDLMELDGDFVLNDYDEGGNYHSFIWGGQVGINQQYGQFVVGLEADISAVHDINHWNWDDFDYLHSYYGNYDGTFWVQSDTKLDWVATFRGRAGLALGHEGRFMPYVTGGAAIARVSSSMSAGVDYYGSTVGWCNPSGGGGGGCGFVGDLPSQTFYQFGYAIGAGLEWAVTNHVTVGLEYLFVGLPWGKQTNTATFYGDDGRSFDVNHTVGFDDLQMIKLKVNLKL
jgi:outer membrane immunogenic protein